MTKQTIHQNSMLLTDTPIEIPLTVTAVNAGRVAQSRLTSMGVLPGEKLTVLRNDTNGPLVLEVKGTRVAIGRGLCQKVMVSQDNEESKE